MRKRSMNRLNLKLGESYHLRLYKLADDMEITVSTLIKKFIDNYDKIIFYEPEDYEPKK